MKFTNQVRLCCFVILFLGLGIVYQLNTTSKPKIMPSIVCTTSIIADVVRNIGDNTMTVTALMGPGIDPHLYKPVESDVIKIASADIIFYNGLHLEAKTAHLLQLLEQRQTTIAITKDIPESMLLPIDDYMHLFDPHVWFDIHLWILCVQTIRDALIAKFPEHKNLYEKNTCKYTQKLKQLFIQTTKIMHEIPANKKVLITGHDAFSYFGRLYNCKVIGLQGISTESSPGAYDLAHIIQLICTHNIPAIFIESSIPIKNILAVQEGVAAHHKKIDCGGELYSDALGPIGSSGETYIDMIMHNVTTIATALQK